MHAWGDGTRPGTSVHSHGYLVILPSCLSVALRSFGSAMECAALNQPHGRPNPNPLPFHGGG